MHLALPANDSPMNTQTSINAAPTSGPTSAPTPGPTPGSPKPTAAEAKARLLAWGDRADAGRAQLISSVVSGVMPLVATGAIGIVGGYLAKFFIGKRSKASKPDPAAANNKAPSSGIGNLLSAGNLIKVAVWLVPLILKHQASAKQK